MRFRVSVGEASPLHPTLAAVPEGRRGAVLVSLAEQALAQPSLLPAVERIAGALEDLASRVTGPPAAAAQEPQPAQDPRLRNLDRDWVGGAR